MHAQLVTDWAQENGVEITAAQMDLLANFQARVLEANTRMNLTAITEPADFAVKHIIDSLTLLPLFGAGADVGASLIDIGTGAGFPGMVLRIMCARLHEGALATNGEMLPSAGLKVTLLDSTLKRVNFLRETAEGLGLPTECIHARAEEFSRTKAFYRAEKFDFATARAVAALDKLAGYALPFVKTGGIFFAMKGPAPQGEIDMAAGAIARHGGIVETVHAVEIAEGIVHSIVVIRKKN